MQKKKKKKRKKRKLKLKTIQKKKKKKKKKRKKSYLKFKTFNFYCSRIITFPFDVFDDFILLYFILSVFLYI